jgi:hypothetical protein
MMLASVKPVGWGVVFGALAFGLLAAAMGWRVWQGKPINPRNTLEAENGLAVLSVTLLPDSMIFLCWAAIGLVSQVGAGSTGGIEALLTLVQLVLGLLSLFAFFVAASLFFTSRPARFVPPHLRRPAS